MWSSGVPRESRDVFNQTLWGTAVRSVGSRVSRLISTAIGSGPLQAKRRRREARREIFTTGHRPTINSKPDGSPKSTA